jgi:carbonic anhydrase
MQRSDDDCGCHTVRQSHRRALQATLCLLDEMGIANSTALRRVSPAAAAAVNRDGAHILGSMEFACKLAGAKVVLVMGHTACGAVKGAIANAELGNLTGLPARIKPAVEATSYSGERSANNYAFVDAVARKNVEMTVADIRKDSDVLAELEAQGTIKITSAIYNLETGAVEFLG